MPDPVGGPAATAAIASLIRQAVSTRTDKSRQKATASGGAKTKRSPGGQAKPPLAALITARAEELDAEAPDFRSRMLRLVVEASLLHEFGHALINAPKFQDMVDQILRDLEAAPQLKRDIDAVLEGLTTSGPPSASPA